MILSQNLSSRRGRSRVERQVSGGGKGLRPPKCDQKVNDGLEKTLTGDASGSRSVPGSSLAGLGREQQRSLLEQ